MLTLCTCRDGNSAVIGFWGRVTLLRLLFGSGDAPGKPHKCVLQKETRDQSETEDVSISVLIKHQKTLIFIIFESDRLQLWAFLFLLRHRVQQGLVL